MDTATSPVAGSAASAEPEEAGSAGTLANDASSSVAVADVPLYDLILQRGVLDESTGLGVLSQLVELLKSRDAERGPIVPENIFLRGDRVVIGAGGATSGTSASAFTPPEAQSSSSSVIDASESEPAQVWALGMLLYTLHAGYSPFASTTDACPFFKEFRSTHRLACPVRCMRGDARTRAALTHTLPPYTLAGALFDEHDRNSHQHGLDGAERAHQPRRRRPSVR